MNIGKQRVVVVGGGLAGCTAALKLADTGAKVTLLEAKRSLGGRTGSFSMPTETGGEGQGGASTTQEVDYCQHVAMGCCDRILALINRLGQQDEWQRHKTLHFYGPTGDYQRLAALPLVPAPLHLAGWLLRWPGLGVADRACIARGMLWLNRLRESTDLDEVSAIQWLNQNRQTGRAIDRFWSTIIVSALGEELDQVSLDAVRKVMQDGFLRRRDAFHLVVPKKPLSQLFGEQMLDTLLSAGVEVQTGCRVNSIKTDSDGSVTVQAGENCWHAERIVVAIPWHQLSSLAAASPAVEQMDVVASQASELKSSPISGVHTWWDRPWLRTPHAAIVGRLCQWVFPEPNLQDDQSDDRPTYYQIVISASRELPSGGPQELEQLIRDDLEKTFPGVSDAKLLRMKVVTDPRAVFSVQPGARRMRPASRLNDWCYLAGDWTDTGWPATMEGAVRSGEQAAESIISLTV
ncbi:MAG: hydroxysqualene dehydroxylase HpnE [Aureliella sp.]